MAALEGRLVEIARRGGELGLLVFGAVCREVFAFADHGHVYVLERGCLLLLVFAVIRLGLGELMLLGCGAIRPRAHAELGLATYGLYLLGCRAEVIFVLLIVNATLSIVCFSVHGARALTH